MRLASTLVVLQKFLVQPPMPHAMFAQQLVAVRRDKEKKKKGEEDGTGTVASEAEATGDEGGEEEEEEKEVRSSLHIHVLCKKLDMRHLPTSQALR